MTKLLKQFVLIVLMVIPLVACGTNGSKQSVVSGRSQSPKTNGKVLIVYFSKAGENYAVGNVKVGNTAVMASYIKEQTGGDIFEIVPENPYPDNYDATEKRAEKEKADNARPAIKNKIANLDQYDVIFIGSPIWVYDVPMIMYTFCETYKDDLAHKTIVPFCTHEGSGISDLEKLLKRYMPEAKYLDSYDVRGRDIRKSKDKVTDWLKSLGFRAK